MTESSLLGTLFEFYSPELNCQDVKKILFSIVILSSFYNSNIIAQSADAEINSILRDISLEEDNNFEYSNNDILIQDQIYNQEARELTRLKKKKKYTFDLAETRAHSNRLNGKTIQAEFWYSQILNQSIDDINYYHYAQMLLTNNKCDDAITWFDEYKKRSNGEVSLTFYESCDEIKNFYVEEVPMRLIDIEGLNSNELDFYAFFYDDDIYFTSNRYRWSLIKKYDPQTFEGYTSIYKADYDVDNNEITNLKALKGDFKKNVHSGTPAFISDTSMVFSFNNNDELEKDEVRPLQLYTARLKNNKWGDFQPLDINIENVTSTHPTLSEDKNKLYFASNREGGFGGMDIYVSEWKDGKWSKPINLGPSVNTAGNELFPFLHSSGTMFFASDGHKTFGGLDIFAVRKVSAELETFWGHRVNMGYPYNSRYDDFGFTIDGYFKKGFFTSNRKGESLSDEIYGWTADSSINVFDRIVDKNLQIHGVREGQLLTNTKFDLHITSEEGDLHFEGVSEDSAIVSFKAKPFVEYTVKVIKSGYVDNTIIIEPMEEYTNVPETHHVTMKRITPIHFEFTNNGVKLPAGVISELVKVVDRTSGEEIKISIDQAYLLSNVVESHQYDIVFDGKKINENNFEVDGNKVSANENYLTFELNLSSDDSEALSTFVNSSGETWDVATMAINTSTIDSKDTKSTLTSNAVIVYFDYDKYRVKNEYFKELNAVVNQLVNNKESVVILESYTDSRGSKNYNKRLATKRSKSVMKYLKSKGVKNKQITTHSHGEIQADVNCNDESCHRLNRKTKVVFVPSGLANN